MRPSLWLATLTCMALGACVNGHLSEGPEPLTPTERYAIAVKPSPQELQLAVHPEGLSQTQVAALADFAGRYQAAEAGDVVLKAPEHGPDPAAAYRTAAGARDYLASQGVDPSRIRIVGYEAGGDAKAPVVVGFMRYEAKGPDCDHGWSNLSAIADNREYPEFGCAVTADIAAQIAYPQDLLQPHPTDPSDEQRRDSVIGKYRQGTPTSTSKDPQADGTFSGIGN
ncbi:MAG TPA: CpaD family pilus assembly protein [Caulobacteraceae bacterium]